MPKDPNAEQYFDCNDEAPKCLCSECCILSGGVGVKSPECQIALNSADAGWSRVCRGNTFEIRFYSENSIPNTKNCEKTNENSSLMLLVR